MYVFEDFLHRALYVFLTHLFSREKLNDYYKKNIICDNFIILRRKEIKDFLFRHKNQIIIIIDISSTALYFFLINQKYYLILCFGHTIIFS